MLAKNSIKAERGLAFISVHTLIFNVRDSDWFAGFADWMAGDFLSYSQIMFLQSKLPSQTFERKVKFANNVVNVE